MTDPVSAPESSAGQPDGAAFFDGMGLHALLYDSLYGGVDFGDLPFYEMLASQQGGNILDAACGTGRVFAALAGPGRRVEAFDASDTLLKMARERVETLGIGAFVGLSRQRLESFRFPMRFDLILLAYYGFSYLLDAPGRAACLRQVAAHLKPGGKAVLHLPAPDLLMRHVPANELDAMRSTRTLRDGNGVEYTVEQSVNRMHYDAGKACRSVEIEVVVKDAGGRSLRRDVASMHYACADAAELEALAAAAGLALTDRRSGFREGSDSELVVTLATR